MSSTYNPNSIRIARFPIVDFDDRGDRIAKHGRWLFRVAKMRRIRKTAFPVRRNQFELFLTLGKGQFGTRPSGVCTRAFLAIPTFTMMTRPGGLESVQVLLLITESVGICRAGNRPAGP